MIGDFVALLLFIAVLTAVTWAALTINYNFFEVPSWSPACDVIKESVMRSRCRV